MAPCGHMAADGQPRRDDHAGRGLEASMSREDQSAPGRSPEIAKEPESPRHIVHINESQLLHVHLQY
jgi:hypothetical protein